MQNYVRRLQFGGEKEEEEEEVSNRLQLYSLA